MQLRIDGARVWDGEAEFSSKDPISIGISDSEIVSMDARGERAEEEVIQCPPGSVMIPGLIDAHVHLDLDPTIMKPDDQFTPSRHDRDLRMIARAQAMVRAGITTARDLGAGEWREILLRDAIARQEVPGPRLLCVGQPLTIPDGHCHFWGGVADTKSAREEVIARQLDREVDWIKIMATGGVFTPGSRVDGAQFSESEIEHVVTVAARAGRAVAAHCHGREGIRNAARAGVRTIEHCSFAGKGGFGVDYDPGVVSEIASREAWVSPTINGNWQHRIHKNGERTDFYRRTRAVLAGLREAGVPLIASTDAGIPGVHHHGLWSGLVAMAHYAALSPREALCSATSESARALGLEDVCGVLRPGLSADLVILPGDPLKDLGQLSQPLWVVAQGNVVRRP
ncbi:MAG: amidohydrolase family protein [Myxococcota bacterium]